MSLFNNSFTRICTSGFGTDTAAGKALGYTVLLCGFGVVAVFYAGKGIYKLATKSKKENGSEEK